MLLLNATPIAVTMFPDHTSQVWKIPPIMLTKESFVEWRFEDEGEFMHLVQLVTLLRATHGDAARIRLYMPYLPYARQDKTISNTTTFALWPFLVLLDQLKFEHISVFDPHSPLIQQIADKKSANYNTPIIVLSALTAITAAIDEVKPHIILFPDSGAAGRYGPLLSGLAKDRGINLYSARKVRQPETGAIIGTYVPTMPAGSTVLMVDDICDGGMTFIKIAEQIPFMNIHLYVSHGLFTKGLEPLRNAGIKFIFTKDGRA